MRNKGKAAPGRRRPGPVEAWARQSPSLAVGIFSTLPLWLAYEGARCRWGATLPPNGAEAALRALFGAMGPAGAVLLRLLAGGLVAGAGVLVWRRRTPLFRVATAVLLEGLLWGTLLGPLGLLVARELVLGPVPLWPTGFFTALGAGLYEELLFRLLLLSLLRLLLVRAFDFHGLPALAATGAALLLQGLLFALAHHLAPGSPPAAGWAMLFRTVMGVLLGILFLLRGFGVVAYAHGWYDILFFWSAR